MSETARNLTEKILEITKEEIQRHTVPLENAIIDLWLEQHGPYCPTLTEKERQQIIKHVVYGECLVLRCTFSNSIKTA